MNESGWFSTHAALLLCLLGSVLVTVLPKILPVTFLKGDSLPPLLRHWLSFVPVAVMWAPCIRMPDFSAHQQALATMCTCPACTRWTASSR